MSVWDELASRVEDCPDNRNNRFEVAADLNRKISGGPFPFWGCPWSILHAEIYPSLVSVDPRHGEVKDAAQ